ncbi:MULTISPECIES: class I SAM-dependent methyltransferase [Nocardia]|uniref:class I SAM-dependent methyltransferase n=1 Tax=Nocardia TaxID=1817 RepID=UPI001892F357|nr:MULTISPECIES: class I SAM-dependent methyltransferase [Nocardia]MBF6215681.1 class I SAM-dependent methyltransferase [Nocardia puris]
MDGLVSSAELDGAKPYSPGLLRVYDAWVLGFNNSRVWRCDTSHLLEQYQRLASDSHLDIGPGTGWFLQRVYQARPAVVELVDLNPHPLAMAASRLRQNGIHARTHQSSVLRPLPVDRTFDSVAASLLMHCVPGGWDEKGVAFQHIADVTTDVGVFFGSTVLAEPTTALSRAVGHFFRSRGAFHHAADDEAGLRRALEAAWTDVQLRRVGQVALWTARGPRRHPSV